MEDTNVGNHVHRMLRALAPTMESLPLRPNFPQPFFRDFGELNDVVHLNKLRLVKMGILKGDTKENSMNYCSSSHLCLNGENRKNVLQELKAPSAVCAVNAVTTTQSEENIQTEREHSEEKFTKSMSQTSLLLPVLHEKSNIIESNKEELNVANDIAHSENKGIRISAESDNQPDEKLCHVGRLKSITDSGNETLKLDMALQNSPACVLAVFDQSGKLIPVIDDCLPSDIFSGTILANRSETASTVPAELQHSCESKTCSTIINNCPPLVMNDQHENEEEQCTVSKMSASSVDDEEEKSECVSCITIEAIAAMEFPGSKKVEESQSFIKKIDNINENVIDTTTDSVNNNGESQGTVSETSALSAAVNVETRDDLSCAPFHNNAILELAGLQSIEGCQPVIDNYANSNKETLDALASHQCSNDESQKKDSLVTDDQEKLVRVDGITPNGSSPTDFLVATAVAHDEAYLEQSPENEGIDASHENEVVDMVEKEVGVGEDQNNQAERALLYLLDEDSTDSFASIEAMVKTCVEDILDAGSPRSDLISKESEEVVNNLNHILDVGSPRPEMASNGFEEAASNLTSRNGLGISISPAETVCNRRDSMEHIISALVNDICESAVKIADGSKQNEIGIAGFLPYEVSAQRCGSQEDNIVVMDENICESINLEHEESNAQGKEVFDEIAKDRAETILECSNLPVDVNFLPENAPYQSKSNELPKNAADKRRDSEEDTIPAQAENNCESVQEIEDHSNEKNQPKVPFFSTEEAVIEMSDGHDNINPTSVENIHESVTEGSDIVNSNSAEEDAEDGVDTISDISDNELDAVCENEFDAVKRSEKPDVKAAFECDDLDRFLDEFSMDVTNETSELATESSFTSGIQIVSANPEIAEDKQSSGEPLEIATNSVIPLSKSTEVEVGKRKNVATKRTRPIDVKSVARKRTKGRERINFSYELQTEEGFSYISSKSYKLRLTGTAPNLLKHTMTNCYAAETRNVGLVIYPGPRHPLPSAVQFHLRKIRSETTVIDEQWANFAVSALPKTRRERFVIPVKCPIDVSSPVAKEAYDAAGKDRLTERQCEINENVEDEVQNKVRDCQVILKKLIIPNMARYCMIHDCYRCKNCFLVTSSESVRRPDPPCFIRKLEFKPLPDNLIQQAKLLFVGKSLNKIGVEFKDLVKDNISSVQVIERSKLFECLKSSQLAFWSCAQNKIVITPIDLNLGFPRIRNGKELRQHIFKFSHNVPDYIILYKVSCLCWQLCMGLTSSELSSTLSLSKDKKYWISTIYRSSTVFLDYQDYSFTPHWFVIAMDQPFEKLRFQWGDSQWMLANKFGSPSKCQFFEVPEKPLNINWKFGYYVSPRLFPFVLFGPFSSTDAHYLSFIRGKVSIPAYICKDTANYFQNKHKYDECPIKKWIHSGFTRAWRSVEEVEEAWLIDLTDRFELKLKREAFRWTEGISEAAPSPPPQSLLPAVAVAKPKVRVSVVSHERSVLKLSKTYLVSNIPALGYFRIHRSEGKSFINIPQLRGLQDLDNDFDKLTDELRYLLYFYPSDLDLHWRAVGKIPFHSHPFNPKWLHGKWVLTFKGLFLLKELTREVCERLRFNYGAIQSLRRTHLGAVCRLVQQACGNTQSSITVTEVVAVAKSYIDRLQAQYKTLLDLQSALRKEVQNKKELLQLMSAASTRRKQILRPCDDDNTPTVWEKSQEFARKRKAFKIKLITEAEARALQEDSGTMCVPSPALEDKLYYPVPSPENEEVIEEAIPSKVITEFLNTHVIAPKSSVLKQMLTSEPSANASGFSQQVETPSATIKAAMANPKLPILKPVDSQECGLLQRLPSSAINIPSVSSPIVASEQSRCIRKVHKKDYPNLFTSFQGSQEQPEDIKFSNYKKVGKQIVLILDRNKFDNASSKKSCMENKRVRQGRPPLSKLKELPSTETREKSPATTKNVEPIVTPTLTPEPVLKGKVTIENSSFEVDVGEIRDSPIVISQFDWAFNMSDMSVFPSMGFEDVLHKTPDKSLIPSYSKPSPTSSPDSLHIIKAEHDYSCSNSPDQSLEAGRKRASEFDVPFSSKKQKTESLQARELFVDENKLVTDDQVGNNSENNPEPQIIEDSINDLIAGSIRRSLEEPDLPIISGVTSLRLDGEIEETLAVQDSIYAKPDAVGANVAEEYTEIPHVVSLQPSLEITAQDNLLISEFTCPGNSEVTSVDHCNEKLINPLAKEFFPTCASLSEPAGAKALPMVIAPKVPFQSSIPQTSAHDKCATPVLELPSTTGNIPCGLCTIGGMTSACQDSPQISSCASKAVSELKVRKDQGDNPETASEVTQAGSLKLSIENEIPSSLMVTAPINLAESRPKIKKRVKYTPRRSDLNPITTKK